MVLKKVVSFLYVFETFLTLRVNKGYTVTKTDSP
jgi:hypothetical protein